MTKKICIFSEHRIICRSNVILSDLHFKKICTLPVGGHHPGLQTDAIMILYVTEILEFDKKNATTLHLP